jgi:hypothetical protein
MLELEWRHMTLCGLAKQQLISAQDVLDGQDPAIATDCIRAVFIRDIWMRLRCQKY